jgi:hypothetical protein
MDIEDIMFRLELSQSVVWWLAIRELTVVLRGWRIYRNRVNCSVMEGSDEYTDRFCLTSVKMEELLSMGGPFLHRQTNRSRAAGEKQLIQIAQYWLGTGGQYQAGGDMRSVSEDSACICVFISDTRWWGCFRRKYRCTVPVADLQLFPST